MKKRAVRMMRMVRAMEVSKGVEGVKGSLTAVEETFLCVRMVLPSASNEPASACSSLLQLNIKVDLIFFYLI